MALFWFILAVLFFVLWRNAKNPTPSSSEDDYNQGYWDGYRALGDEVQAQLDGDEVSRDELARLIAVGYGGIVPQNTAQPRTAEIAATDVTSASMSSYVEQPPIVSSLEPDSEYEAAQKEQKTLKNLNTILYMASFLFVAAAAALIAAAMPAGVRLIGLITVVILFYGVGMVLYKKVERLRPAAIAFVGTGLAILPFVGVALTVLGSIPEAQAWFIISIVGVVAYWVAAIVLQSQVVSYLTMAFVLSLASSVVATASLPIVWYFIVLIGIGLVASSISILKPALMPQVFRRPVETTGQVITPLSLLASIFVFDRMTIDMYQVVFGMATAHYLVTWLQQRRLVYETVARGLAHITLLIVAWDVAADSSVFGIWWLALAVAQGGYSLFRVGGRFQPSFTAEKTWLSLVFASVLYGILFWTVSNQPALWTTISLTSIALIGVLAAYRLREARWAYTTLAAFVALVFVLGRWLAEPVWDWSVITAIFTSASVAALATYTATRKYDRPNGEQQLFAVALVTFVVCMLVCAQFTGDIMATAWTYTIAAALLVVFSYVSRVIASEVIGGILTTVAIGMWLSQTTIDSAWYIMATVLLSAGVVAIGMFIHHFLGEKQRRNSLLILAQVLYGGLVLAGLHASPVVAQTALVLLIVGAFASFGARVALRTASATLRSALSVGYFVYLFLAWLLVFGLGPGWSVLAYGAAALLLWLGSYMERMPGLTVVGNVSLLVVVATLWSWLDFSTEWAVFGVAWIVAAVLYGIYWLTLERADAWRSLASLVSVWVVLAGAVLLQFADTEVSQRVAVAATVVVGATTLAIHGYVQRRHDYIEVGIYLATLGLQRLVGIAVPEANTVFYAHWWAATLALVAWWRTTNRANRLVVGMALITASTGIMALGEGGGYQVLFLIEHLALLVAGAILGKQWAVWWGVAAASAAILYFLKDYVFLWLGFLGLVLIAIVVWRLTKLGKR